MPETTVARTQHRTLHQAGFGFVFLAAALLLQPIAPASAYPSPLPVNLGAASTFSVLGAAAVTNTGPTVIGADTDVGGNLGVSPLTSVTGFPPGSVTPPGTIHSADVEAAAAQTAAGTAYDDAAGRAPDETFGPVYDLGGRSLLPGVYKAPTSLALTGSVTLDGDGNPDAVFIFQAGSTLVTGASSTVLLTNGAQACNVFWQVGSSATFGASSMFNGTVIALAAASLGDDVTLEGRVLARVEAVTLINDRIHAPACAPESGVPQAPLFGPLGYGVALAAFLAGVAVLVLRRRVHLGETR